MSDWLGLRDKRVLIVGAGDIGEALARGFHEAGAVVALGDISEKRLAELAEVAAFTQQLDVRSAEECRALVGATVEQLGQLDVFVHCVGINDRRPIESYSDEDWERIIAINLTSAFSLGQAAATALRERGGRIIFFSSVAGLMGHKDHGPYAATKGGINQLTKVMANELAATGVTVNAMAPGYVETNLTAAHLEKPGVREKLVSLVPAGRLGTPAELVGPVLFLASEQAGFITGHVLYVDGGRTTV